MTAFLSRVCGTWRPGMPQDVSLLVLLLFSIQMVSHGADYILGNGAASANFTSVERAMPLWLWGALFLSVAATILVGFLFRRTMMVFYGAVVAGALYLGLSWGMAMQIWNNRWPIDKWTGATQYLTVGIFWLLIAYGTRVMHLARTAEFDEHRGEVLNE